MPTSENDIDDRAASSLTISTTTRVEEEHPAACRLKLIPTNNATPGLDFLT